ncbi:MAG: SoxR reducing system RseC family protein [Clostridia bacterium]|nr:SoxR reducing system RseC family protein [Clostridia bacterium]
MKREATVVLHKGKLCAMIERPEACGDCRACDFGRKEKMHYPLSEGNYKEGDKVLIEISDRALGRATLIAYGLPLLSMLLGLTLGAVLFKAEWAQALSALSALLAGWLIIRATEKKRGRNQIYTCRAQKMNPK